METMICDYTHPELGTLYADEQLKKLAAIYIKANTPPAASATRKKGELAYLTSMKVHNSEIQKAIDNGAKYIAITIGSYTGCPPCRTTHSNFLALEGKRKDMAFFAVDVNKHRDVTNHYGRQATMPYNVVLKVTDGKAEKVSEAFGIINESFLNDYK